MALVSGEEYAKPALCLRRQLTRVGTVCPVHLVIDDRQATLSNATLGELQDAYGAKRLISLVSLIHAAHQVPPSHGRRLLHGRRGPAAASAKVWLWAMAGFEVAAFLDLDIFVNRNIDALLTRSLDDSKAFAAVPACATKEMGSVLLPNKSKVFKHVITARFNSGIFVFRPSLATMGRLELTYRFIAQPWRGHLPDVVFPFLGYKPAAKNAPYPAGKLWPDKCAPPDEPMAHARLFPNASKSFLACRMAHGGRDGGRLVLRMPLACEPKHTDQSVLNSFYGNGHWQPLADVYNVHWLNAAWCAQPGASFTPAGGTARHWCPKAAIVHFVGEPKPWAKWSSSSRRLRPGTAGPAAAHIGGYWRGRWRDECSYKVDAEAG